MKKLDPLEKQEFCLQITKHRFELRVGFGNIFFNCYKKIPDLMSPCEKKLHICLFCFVLYLTIFSHSAVTQEELFCRGAFFSCALLSVAAIFQKERRIEMGR